jgi:hypothetical protein
MEVHQHAPMDVHVTQPLMEQQQPHPSQEPQMVVLESTFNNFGPHVIVLSHSRLGSSKG